jgi:radical SAM-linked protein
MVRLRVRIRFAKQGDLRLIGHRDLMRCLERLMRRANLPLGRSQGFHPKPRLTFPLALAVGIEGIDEVMELELAETLPGEEILQRLRAQAPAGLTFHSVAVLPEGCPKVRVRSASYEAPIPPACRAGLRERIEHLLAAATWPVARPRHPRPIDLRPLLLQLALGEEALAMRLRIDQQGSVGPREVLNALGLADLEQRGVRLRRSSVEVCA